MSASPERLPEPVRRALADRGAGPLVGFLPTDRTVPLPRLGRPRSAPLWLVRAETGVWLVAAVEADETGAVSSLAVAGAARVDDGFPAGAVVVEAVRARLPRTLVEQARTLVRRAPQARTLGFDVRLQERTESAPGEAPYGSPEGFPTGAGPEPWLYALETASTVRWPGRLRDLDRTVWLGFTESSVFAVVLGEGTRGLLRLDAPMARGRRFPTHVLEVGEVDLSIGLFGGHRLDLAVALAAAEAGPRWALVGVELWDTGRREAALALCEAGVDRGHRDALLPVLTRIFAVSGRGAEAASALARAPEEMPLRNFEGFARALNTGEAWDPDTSRRLAEAAALDPLEPSDGAPWPPRGPAEIWAAGRGTLPEGFVSAAPDRVRALRVVASLASTGDSWRAAALAGRAAGDRAGARDDLARALALDPVPATAWQALAWALEDAAREDEALRAALALDPTGAAASTVLGAHALENAADRAERLGLDGASALLESADATLGEETTPSQRWSRAERIRRAGDLLLAAKVFARFGAASEESPDDPERPRWKARIAAARAYASAGESEKAQDQLERAVAGDFLHAEALRAAASVEGVVSDDRRAWWLHVAAVLDGASRAPAPGGSSRLSKAALDALHPGDQDWWDDVRTQINLPSLPARDALIRGLSRLEGQEFPEVFALVSELSKALGLEPVPTYVYRGDDAVGISGWPTQPPVLLVGVEHLREGPRQLSPASLRFALSVEIAHLAAGHPVLAFDDSLLGTSRSVYQAFGRFAGTAETAVDLVSLIPGVDQLAKLQLLFRLSRRVFFVRKAFDKATGLVQPLLNRFFPTEKERSRGLSRRGLSGAALAFRVQADRAALRLGGDLEAAVGALVATGDLPAVRLDRLARGGLSALLEELGEEDDEVPLGADEAFRLVALVEEAATRGPFSADVTPERDGQLSEKSSLS